jgi:site-specific DNA recombinase
VPIRLRRRGVESRIILGGTGAQPTVVDAVLLKALARGRRWFQELASKRAKDIISIAGREGFHQSYVKRLLPLAFLAPVIVEMICTGHQPPELTVERLTRGPRLPLDWICQSRALGLFVASYAQFRFIALQLSQCG